MQEFLKCFDFSGSPQRVDLVGAWPVFGGVQDFGPKEELQV